ncbi:MAG TPA: histidine--tRNA ligase [Phycisphaerales bacterium]|nr:histidine--tRNA ligase [Phycisphaerales bacterium]
MKIPAVKGTRDFYPPLMALRNCILDGWKEASLRNGFAEYDGPIFEYLKMYQVKSGDEIAEQLFNFTDRGDRKLAIRPEITPTLARMVNQQINSLPRPIKWFSLPRLCRAERPQKGRLREFFQWNIDIIGADDVIADAEIIYTAVDYLRSLGLTANDIVVRISSRSMLAAFLEAIGIPEEKLDGIYAILDKKAKLPEAAFDELLEKQLPDAQKRDYVLKLMAAGTLEELKGMAAELGNEKLDIAKETKSIVELETLFGYFETMGIADYCKFDITIVRGLAYYTGPVYEIYDKSCELRAIAGGGRYDDLLKMFGGPQVSGTGLGMGDCVLGILLEEKGLLNETIALEKQTHLDYFVAYTDMEQRDAAVKIAAALREKGKKTSFSYKPLNFKKQLKQASAANADACVILALEYQNVKELIIKDMKDGSQKQVPEESFLKSI